jgi:hypothetical protein
MKFLLSFMLIGCGLNLFGEVIYSHKEEAFGTWTIEDSPIIIQGEVIIPPNHELFIESGVEVLFKTGNSQNEKGNKIGNLRVLGVLVAEGSETSFIKFTRLGDSGKWGVIVLENVISPSYFKYCEIEHSQHVSNVAGAHDYKGAISLKDNAQGIIANSSIHDNDLGIQISRTSAGKTPFLYMNYIYQNKIAGIFSFQSSHLIIEKNVIENSKTGILCTHYASPIIRNNIIKNVNEGVMSFHYSSSKLENNQINANTHGILAMDKCTILVYNTIIENADFAVTLDGNSEMLLENSSLVLIKNAGINMDNQSSVFVQNSILWSMPDETNFSDSKSKVTFSYSLFENQVENEQVELVKGNIMGMNPQFQDLLQGNYRLSCDVFDKNRHSPCIDKGNPTFAYNDKTINWNTGWWTVLNDIGAYGGPRNSNWNLPEIMKTEIASRPLFFLTTNNFAFLSLSRAPLFK